MPDSTPLSPLRLLLVGPTSPAGEQLIEQLSEGPRPPALVGADVGDAVGGEYEWRGESETVLDLDSVAQDTFDVVVLAVPVGPRRLPRAGHVLLLPGAGREGRVVLHGLTDPPGAGERVRLPDPVACLVATLVQVLSAAAQVRGVEVVTFESASALGRAGMDELRDQTIDLLNFREPRALVFSRRLAFDTCSVGPDRRAISSRISTSCCQVWRNRPLACWCPPLSGWWWRCASRSRPNPTYAPCSGCWKPIHASWSRRRWACRRPLMKIASW
jgi:hypothetical protein